MIIEFLNGHKSVVGHVEGTPYHVTADENGIAEVDEAVGAQLIQLRAAVPVKASATDDIDAMTVKELRVYASEKGVSLGSARSKAEILEVLKSTEENGKGNENPEGTEKTGGDE